MEKEYDVLGIDNLLVDYVAEVDESVLKEFMLEKGIMHLRDSDTIKKLKPKLKNVEKHPGGSASNVIHGIANLGLKAALAGSIAEDEDGKIFTKDLMDTGVKNCMTCKKSSTGIAASLITPDKERTFIVHYGAADQYEPKDIDKETLKKSKYLHITGYGFESMNKAIRKAVKIAKNHNIKVSFDLADPEVILRNKEELKKFLKKVDVTFANEEEAKTFTGETTPEKALEQMAKYSPIAVVKLGEKGAITGSGSTIFKAQGYKANLVNTLGAGDGFAAGFLYGLCKGHSLEYSCRLGNYYASKIVEEKGARLSYKIPNLSDLVPSH